MPSLELPVTRAVDDQIVYRESAVAPGGGTRVLQDGTPLEAQYSVLSPSLMFRVSNALMVFDSSSLESGTTITTCALRIDVTDVFDADGLSIEGKWQSDPPINALWWDSLEFEEGEAITGYDISGITAGTLTIPLENCSGITHCWTALSLHIGGDVTPSAQNGIIFSAYEAGGSVAPRLIVNYEEAPAEIPEEETEEDVKRVKDPHLYPEIADALAESYSGPTESVTLRLKAFGPRRVAQ